jgi:hypothetical protein
MVASITKRKADGEFVHILERPEEFEGIAYVRLMTRNETCEPNHNCVATLSATLTSSHAFADDFPLAQT